MLVTRALPGISNSGRSVAIPAVDKLVRRAAEEAPLDHAPSDVLTRWLRERPELQTTLALVAQRDDRPSVRRQADDAVVSTRPASNV